MSTEENAGHDCYLKEQKSLPLFRSIFHLFYLQ